MKCFIFTNLNFLQKHMKHFHVLCLYSSWYYDNIWLETFCIELNTFKILQFYYFVIWKWSSIWRWLHVLQKVMHDFLKGIRIKGFYTLSEGHVTILICASTNPRAFWRPEHMESVPCAFVILKFVILVFIRPYHQDTERIWEITSC